MISLYVFGTSRFASALTNVSDAVSIGRRRLAATKPGETPVSRLVEVAAGETAAMNLAGAIGTKPAVGSDTQAPPSGSDRGGNGLIIAGWVGTGALAAGAVVTGILASSKASFPQGRARSVSRSQGRPRLDVA